jgi:hypothetical protein
LRNFDHAGRGTDADPAEVDDSPIVHVSREAVAVTTTMKASRVERDTASTPAASHYGMATSCSPGASSICTT